MGVDCFKLWKLEGTYANEYEQMGIPRLYLDVQLDVVALLNAVYRVDEYLREGQQNSAFGLLWETRNYLKKALTKRLTKRCITRKRRRRTDESDQLQHDGHDEGSSSLVPSSRHGTGGDGHVCESSSSRTQDQSGIVRGVGEVRGGVETKEQV